MTAKLDWNLDPTKLEAALAAAQAALARFTPEDARRMADEIVARERDPRARRPLRYLPMRMEEIPAEIVEQTEFVTHDPRARRPLRGGPCNAKREQKPQ